MCAPKEVFPGPQPEQQTPKKADLPPEPTKLTFAENKNGQLTLF